MKCTVGTTKTLKTVVSPTTVSSGFSRLVSDQGPYSEEEIQRMSASDYKTKVLEPLVLGEEKQRHKEHVNALVQEVLPDKPVKTRTRAQIAKEMQTLELQTKEAELFLLREKVAKVTAEKKLKQDAFDSKNKAVRQFIEIRTQRQEECNHRKGGHGAYAVDRGQGTDVFHAVIKHRKPNGRLMILCQRCNKEWHEAFWVGGVLMEPETPGFQEAKNFITDNQSSGSGSFFYSPVYENKPIKGRKSKTTRSLTAKGKKHVK